ncbi:S1C family serine protease [Calditrichota bacterium]
MTVRPYIIHLTAIFLTLNLLAGCNRAPVLESLEKDIIAAVKDASSGIVGIEITYAADDSGHVSSRWGDGVIIEEDGSIVTTQSLIEGATRIVVMFQDGCSHEGTVLGSDRETNLALVMTPAHAHGCFPVKIKTTDNPPTGSMGILIGHNWISRGVSAGIGLISQTWLGGDDFWSDPLCLIQTADQLVQPGVGVVNTQGSLIGICDNHAAESSGAWTIIPSATIKRVIEKLRVDGEIERGYAGLFCNCDLNDAHVNQPPEGGGVEILRVANDSPAMSAGIQPGDYVVSMDDKQALTANDLRLAITALLPGQKVQMGVVSEGGSKRIVTLTLGELDDYSNRNRRCTTRSM